jgi:catalase
VHGGNRFRSTNKERPHGRLHDPTIRSTTGTGAPAPSDRNSLTVGADGPIVLHDVHFLEQMAHFNREKTIERQPHAKGSGAFRVFETTEDVSPFTRAALFQQGAVTGMLARFSTVAGEQGSPDTWRDVRWFSLKFYTDEGNYDLVGNKMLLGRAFAYADAQRNRIGANFHQLPVNQPKVPVNTYMVDGRMAYHHSGAAPVYATNSAGRPWADETGPAAEGWEADGEMVRSASTLHAEDDDFTQPGILVREVFDDDQRAGLIDQVAGSLLGGVREPVLSRAFDYWKSIDPDVGARIKAQVRAGSAPQPAERMGES